MPASTTKKTWCMKCRTRHLTTTPHDDEVCPTCGQRLLDLRGTAANHDALIREGTCFQWSDKDYTCARKYRIGVALNRMPAPRPQAAELKQPISPHETAACPDCRPFPCSPHDWLVRYGDGSSARPSEADRQRMMALYGPSSVAHWEKL